MVEEVEVPAEGVADNVSGADDHAVVQGGKPRRGRQPPAYLRDYETDLV